MGGSASGIIKLLRLLSILSILATFVTLFVYSPYYAKTILWALNTWVPVQVDPVAAKSQQAGQLNLENHLEPGSKEWVARRAYLYEINQVLQVGDIVQFVDLQIRYQELLDNIKQEQAEKAEQVVRPPLSAKIVANEETSSSEEIERPSIFLENTSVHNNEPLFQKYREFLREDENLSEVNLNPQLEEEIQQNIEPLIFKRMTDQPHAIVILGGGLMAGKKKGEIVVNPYTQKRLEIAVETYKKHPLPILLSGVEAPYMQKWLAQHHIEAQFLENRSMNTCENTRFTALMLQKQGGAPTVYLITDIYHMPRSQRLFALNGIMTMPIKAPLPNTLTEWKPDAVNLMHSRRATYEVLASLRDLWFGESNCREIP